MNPSPDPPANGALRVAAVGDLHVGEDHTQPYRDLFARVSSEADVLVLCGDLTNFGKTREAENLAEDLMACTIPVVGVLGNHDYECGQPDEVAKILHQAGVQVLDGEAYEIGGVGFAGCKGFIGGYGRHMLTAFGEPEIKAFVQAGLNEALKLEKALSQLRTEKRIVVTHYSPIRETVEGEPLEIFPFLGSSRFGEVIDRFGAAFAVHGHAHHGAMEGKTTGGIPVYNVAITLLQSQQPPCIYRVFDI